MKFFMFRTVPLSIIRSFSLYTQQWYMSYRSADSLQAGSGWNRVPSWSCSQAVSKPVWHIPLLRVQWKIPAVGQRNCPKHAEFNSKIRFVKISTSGWFYYKKLNKIHGHVYVKFVYYFIRPISFDTYCELNCRIKRGLSSDQPIRGPQQKRK
jgi:hypothetical protein